VAFLRCCEEKLLDCDGFDRGKTSTVAVVAEFHFAGDLGKERVVGTNADIEARLDACAALAHDDGAASDEFAGKGLDAQPLSIGSRPFVELLHPSYVP